MPPPRKRDKNKPKQKHNRLGIEYKPVKAIDILRCLSNGAKSAEEVGEELWPHLHGRGSPRGGPSACNWAASCQLGRLRAKKLVDQHWSNMRELSRKWYLTGKGQEEVAKAEDDGMMTICVNCDKEVPLKDTTSCPACGNDPLCPNCVCEDCPGEE